MSYIQYRVENHIARIVLDHAPANALSLPMVESLLGYLREARADDDVRVVVLESAIPRRFSASITSSCPKPSTILANRRSRRSTVRHAPAE